MLSPLRRRCLPTPGNTRGRLRGLAAMATMTARASFAGACWCWSWCRSPPLLFCRSTGLSPQPWPSADALPATIDRQPKACSLFLSPSRSISRSHVVGHSDPTMIICFSHAESLSLSRSRSRFRADRSVFILLSCGLRPRAIQGMGVRPSETLEAPPCVDCTAVVL